VRSLRQIRVKKKHNGSRGIGTTLIFKHFRISMTRSSYPCRKGPMYVFHLLHKGASY
jgi:hypothetical protein